MLKPLFERKIVDKNPEQSRLKQSIYFFMAKIHDTLRGLTYCEAYENKLKYLLKGGLKEEFANHEILLTEEEENGLIDVLIAQYFALEFKIPAIYIPEVIGRSAFMQLTFDELKSAVNPPIKNLKVEIKVDPTLVH